MSHSDCGCRITNRGFSIVTSAQANHVEPSRHRGDHKRRRHLKLLQGTAPTKAAQRRTSKSSICCLEMWNLEYRVLYRARHSPLCLSFAGACSCAHMSTCCLPSFLFFFFFSTRARTSRSSSYRLPSPVGPPLCDPAQPLVWLVLSLTLSLSVALLSGSLFFFSLSLAALSPD